MQEKKQLQGLSLPKLEERAKMPWEHTILYTVETPGGELMTMGSQELERYAAGAGKTGR